MWPFSSKEEKEVVREVDLAAERKEQEAEHAAERAALWGVRNPPEKSNITIFIAGPAKFISLHNIEFYKQFADKIVVQYWAAHASVKTPEGTVSGPWIPSQRDIDIWSKDPDADDDPMKFLYKYYHDDKAVKIVPITDPEHDGAFQRLYDLKIITDYHTWYFQVKGIYEALKNVTTPYVIRTRSDEFVDQLNPLIEDFSQNTNKLTCANIFFKNPQSSDGAAGFHVGDHIFMARTDKLFETYKRICGKYDEVIGLDDVKLSTVDGDHRGRSFSVNGCPTDDDVELPAWIDVGSEVFNKVRNPENILGLTWLDVASPHSALEVLELDERAKHQLLLDYFGCVNVHELGEYLLSWGGANQTYDPWLKPYFHGHCLCRFPDNLDDVNWNLYTMKWCKPIIKQPHRTPSKPEDKEYDVKKNQNLRVMADRVDPSERTKITRNL